MDIKIGEHIQQRLNKLANLRQKGIEPYGVAFEKREGINALLENFTERKVIVAGRLMAIRLHGKSIFCDLRDQFAKIQLYIRKDIVGEEMFDTFEKNFDIGDIVGVKGETFRTKTGEPTVKVLELVILSKSLRPLPEKWHGLKDIETRFRQRYVDLIVNQNVKEIFYLRSKMISSIRRFLDERGYLEVETPMMHTIPGGAVGRPFKTHHNALDVDLYLRIAPELYLKRLLVGGFERVYEINRSFRNEGISLRHNPEFTMLEVYTAYSDCRGMMRLTEEMIRYLARELLGTETIEYQGKNIDLNRWQTISFAELMKKNFDINPDDDTKNWVEKLRHKGVTVDKDNISRTQILNLIADLIEPQLHTHPVFVIDLFAEMCPLAKRKANNPLLTDRFELFIGGLEVANAYSELNDPIEQKKRLQKDIEDNAERETSEMLIDEDFVRALEYGMPPAGGLGVGIDRLVMIFTNSTSIREVILFPQLRPERRT